MNQAAAYRAKLLPFALLLTTLGWSVGPRAEQEPARRNVVVFESCPIYRDTDNGRKSGCWLADDPGSGARFDVSDSSGKPWIGRRMIVEGVESGAKNVCGGSVLNPVRISVLDAHCPEMMIPAEGYPSKPSVLPADFIKPLVPARPAREKARPPIEKKTFEVFFELNSDFINYQDSDTVTERAAHYAIDIAARSVNIQGFSDSKGFTLQGARHVEDQHLGAFRAEKIARILIGYGVSPDSINYRMEPIAATSNPLSLTALRRVVITVSP